MDDSILRATFTRWKTFEYNQIFDIKKGSRLTKADMFPGNTPFIGASDARNGVTAYIDRAPDHPANVLTVAYNGSVAEAYYQPVPFCATDDINILYPKFTIDQYVGVFVSSVIKQEKYRFNYGRKWHKERMEQSTISLPVLADGAIDTRSITTYILRLNDNKSVDEIVEKSKQAYNAEKRLRLDTTTWKYFDYEKGRNGVFKIKKGKRLTKSEQYSGNYPYVSSSSFNNGVDNYIGNGYTDENCLSFACYGSIGEVFYQSEKVWVSDNANVFYAKDYVLDPFISLFLVTVLRLEQYRFSYGMTGKKERLQGMRIKLPVDHAGQPDWKYMRAYIKGLSYSSGLVAFN